jgi:hypothetical protein
MTASNVDDAQTSHTKANAPVEKQAVIVGTTIFNRRAHTPKRLLGCVGRHVDVQPPNDAAHVGLNFLMTG